MSWGPPSGAGGWAPWVLAQAVILAVIVLAAAAGWWCLPRRVAERWRWIVSRINGLIAVWLVLIGIALLLDFAVYIHFWSDWAGLPSDYQADSDATFGRAMVEGIGVAVPLVVAVVWGAVILLRRERRDQTASPAPSAEA
ncbi:MAG: hypothetical protein MUO50_08840 [Longimicrobiales bacterium]|nr:hypothetical protein [Longimicrobiales bacterium]